MPTKTWNGQERNGITYSKLSTQLSSMNNACGTVTTGLSVSCRKSCNLSFSSWDGPVSLEALHGLRKTDSSWVGAREAPCPCPGFAGRTLVRQPAARAPAGRTQRRRLAQALRQRLAAGRWLGHARCGGLGTLARPPAPLASRWFQGSAPPYGAVCSLHRRGRAVGASSG